MSAVAIPKQSAVWDERRNSSRVFPVPPDALPTALHALARMRIERPALTRWLEEGHPRLSADEHRARFGEPYKATRSREAR